MWIAKAIIQNKFDHLQKFPLLHSQQSTITIDGYAELTQKSTPSRLLLPYGSYLATSTDFCNPQNHATSSGNDERATTWLHNITSTKLVNDSTVTATSFVTTKSSNVYHSITNKLQQPPSHTTACSCDDSMSSTSTEHSILLLNPFNKKKKARKACSQML
jgi:hypothetical protein